LARLNWRNYSLRLLALLLAFALWLYVSNEQSPLREKTLTIDLEKSGLEQGLVISGGMPETVRVKVQGNRNQLANLIPDDFSAVVNIPAGRTGDLTIPVQVNVPTGLRLAQVTPAEVSLSIDSVAEKQVAVAVSLRGTPGQGYTALAPFYQPDTVVVRGPTRALEGIKQATALIDIQGAVQDVDQILQVSVGSSNVTLEPSAVRVVVPIVEMVPTKIVPVLIQVTGSPAAGYYVKNTVSDPVSVQLSGQPETLIPITNIKTVPLDITGVDNSFAIEVGLAVPQGVIVQPSRVKVQVEVVKGEAPASNVTNESGTEKPKT
jgi:YbbR domain-containing protein